MSKRPLSDLTNVSSKTHESNKKRKDPPKDLFLTNLLQHAAVCDLTDDEWHKLMTAFASASPMHECWRKSGERMTTQSDEIEKADGLMMGAIRAILSRLLDDNDFSLVRVFLALRKAQTGWKDFH